MARSHAWGGGWPLKREKPDTVTAEELETLHYIAEHDPHINKSLREAPRSANDSRGVTYRREYRGKVYEMRSLGDGTPNA